MDSRESQYKSEWRQFEVNVEEVVAYALQPLTHRSGQPKFRASFQKAVVHNGIPKRYDIHIAQRRQGGKAVVLDAKHFKHPLPSHEVQTTHQYKTGGRASACAIVASSTTVIPEATRKTAEKLGVVLIQGNGTGQDLMEKVQGFVMYAWMRCTLPLDNGRTLLLDEA